MARKEIMYLPHVAELDWPAMLQLGPDFRKSYLEWSRNRTCWEELYGSDYRLRYVMIDPALFASYAREQYRATDMGCLLDFAKAVGRHG